MDLLETTYGYKDSVKSIPYFEKSKDAADDLAILRAQIVTWNKVCTLNIQYAFHY